MRSLLNRNDLCALLRYESEESHSPIHYKEVLSALDAPGKYADPKNLKIAQASLNDPSILSRFMANHEASKFYYALWIGGLLGTDDLPKRLLPLRSYRLLTELWAAHPKNGAYPYFRASVRNKLGQDPKLVRSDLLRGLEAPEFNTWFLSLSQEIYKWGLTDPSHYAMATMFIGVLPMPNYANPHHLVLEWIEKDDLEFSQAAGSFGRKLLDQAERASSRREIVFWLAIEQAVGKGIARRVWSKTHPGESLPENLRDLYEYRKLLEKDPYRGAWSKALDEKTCDPHLADEVLETEIRDLERDRLLH